MNDNLYFLLNALNVRRDPSIRKYLIPRSPYKITYSYLSTYLTLPARYTTFYLSRYLPTYMYLKLEVTSKICSGQYLVRKGNLPPKYLL